jgi:hypothetical protein
MTASEKIAGGIVWGILLFIAFWYWNCSDGVRAIKNMHAYEIFHEDVMSGINDRNMALTMSQPMLESMGYNIDLTFEEAIERTKPKKIVFESVTSSLPEFRGKAVKPISVTVTYDPPLDGKYTAITMVIGVQKNWFFHFNPVPVSPAITTYYGNGDTKVLSLPGYSNLQVAEPILKYFRDHK